MRPDDGFYRTTAEKMAEGFLPDVSGPECACEDFDCELHAFGYPFCTGCGEHHRDPVGSPCPVDMAIAEDELAAPLEGRVIVPPGT